MTAICGHYTDTAGLCGAPATGQYLTGPCCPDHTPARLAGHPEPAPDPTRTLEGLRRAWYADQDLDYVPMTTPAASAAIDARAIATGKRRSSPQDYRAAQTAQENHR